MRSPNAGPSTSSPLVIAWNSDFEDTTRSGWLRCDACGPGLHTISKTRYGTGPARSHSPDSSCDLDAIRRLLPMVSVAILGMGTSLMTPRDRESNVHDLPASGVGKHVSCRAAGLAT